ncbi:unnamed protein product [Lampetra planeri]
MNLPAGLKGFWIFALLSLQSAILGETFRFSPIDVPFPPARPTAQNQGAICQYGQGRPRYPDSFFPQAGASHFRRRGTAINRLEQWYSVCCRAQESNVTLCCAVQAWKQALSQFCAEESKTKTVMYECCEDKGEARWTCFDSELPNPNYDPIPGYFPPTVPQEMDFIFSTTDC